VSQENENNQQKQSVVKKKPENVKPENAKPENAKQEKTFKPYFRNNKNRHPKSQNQNQSISIDDNSKSILSVVIPLFNEEESLPELALLLEGELNKITNGRYEVIFIDDGSTDNSWDVIGTIIERNRKFRAVRFRKNQGKSDALQVGFNEAQGVIVITMDADLQDDPAEIKNLITKLKEGYDLVSGWKKVRHDPISKTLPSKFFNFVTSKTSGIKLHDFNCGLKAYRKDVVKTIPVYGEMHRYIPALAHMNGFKVTEIPVEHHPRKYGKTKYGFSRFIKGFLDLLTVMFLNRYMKRPMHFFGTLGTLFIVSGFGIDLYLLIEWMLNQTYLSNRPLMQFGIALIIVGFQMLSLGFLGEMMVKNQQEHKVIKIRDRK
jgi:glycosyltransferase involved in cell wall biosynthesis